MGDGKTDMLSILLKFGLLFFGIFALVFIIALLTPHIAKMIKPNDKPKNPDEMVDEKNYTAKGIYDAQIADDKENLNNKDENDG